jgi:hypothetical protein
VSELIRRSTEEHITRRDLGLRPIHGPFSHDELLATYRGMLRK